MPYLQNPMCKCAVLTLPPFIGGQGHLPLQSRPAHGPLVFDP